MPDGAKTAAEQLAALINDPKLGLTQRSLARSLAIADGHDPSDADFSNVWKSWNRWVPKVLYPDRKGGIRRPSSRRLDLIEEAVGRPGYFERPTAAEVRDHRAELEAEVDDLTWCVRALLLVSGELVGAVQELGGSIPDAAIEELARAVLRMQSGAHPS